MVQFHLTTHPPVTYLVCTATLVGSPNFIPNLKCDAMIVAVQNRILF